MREEVISAMREHTQQYIDKTVAKEAIDVLKKLSALDVIQFESINELILSARDVVTKVNS